MYKSRRILHLGYFRQVFTFLLHFKKVGKYRRCIMNFKGKNDGNVNWVQRQDLALHFFKKSVKDVPLVVLS